MLSKDRIKIVFSSVVTLVPLIAGLCLWNRLPEKMATSFNMNGEVTGYSSRTFAVIGLPVFLFAINLVCLIATNADPKRANIGSKLYNVILCVVPACSLFCGAVIYGHALGYNINIEVVMPTVIGVVFVVIGYFLPKCKHNYTVGIKLPWTIYDEDNWNKTHKLAGPIWMIGGVVMIFTALMRWFIAYITVIILVAVIPSVYSYVIYKRKTKDISG